MYVNERRKTQQTKKGNKIMANVKMTEREFLNLVINGNINEDQYERAERLGEFLDLKELDCVDLFDMSETDRQELVKEFEEWLVGDAEIELLEGCFSEEVIEL